MGAVKDEEPDAPIDAAEEGEIRRLRVDAIGDGVRNADGELHGAAHAEEAGDVGIEAGIAALVTGDKFAAYEDFRRLRDAVKAEVCFLVLFEGEGGKRAGVGAFAAEIIAAAVLTVDGVPGVRQGDFFACLRRSLSGRLRFVGGGRRRIFEEYPIVVECDDHGRKWFFAEEAFRVVCGFLLLLSFGFCNPSVTAPKHASDAATASRAVETALRSGNGAHNAPFPSSQVVKAPPGLCQESAFSPLERAPIIWSRRGLGRLSPSYPYRDSGSSRGGRRRGRSPPLPLFACTSDRAPRSPRR